MTIWGEIIEVIGTQFIPTNPAKGNCGTCSILHVIQKIGKSRPIFAKAL